MPNRILKETILTSESLNALSAEAERLFYRLMTIADDWGRMEADLRIILAHAYPLKILEITTAQVDAWVSELEREQIVKRYVVGGRAYLCFMNWRKHNQVRNQKSKYPDPPATEKPLKAIVRIEDDPKAVASNCMQPHATESGCEQLLAYTYSDSDTYSDKTEPKGSGEGGASPRERSEPFDSISEVLTQCAAKLDGDPPDREEVVRWCKSGSALRKLIDKFGVAKTVNLKVWVTQHKSGGADWNLLWAERNTWLAQMRDGVAFVPRGETGNGKKPHPPSDELIRPKVDVDFWYGPPNDEGVHIRLAILNGRHTKKPFDEAAWLRERGIDPAQEIDLR